MDTSLLPIAARALAANPFTAERAALDVELTRGEPGERAFERALRELEPIARQAWTTRRGAGSDREIAFRAYLFALFHRHRPAMASLLAAERAGAATSASFALELLAELEEAGLPTTRAERLVGLFYQTERAFDGLRRELRGPCPSMQRLRASLWNALFTHDLSRYEATLWDRMEDFSTLLLGETGTGKGAAASALGHGGIAPFDRRLASFAPARSERFVAVNLAEVPDTLVESALFGHEKGSFTGADRAHDGLLRRVPKHGAIFLDELGDVPPHVQVKLLRVLQDRTFTPLGGKKPLPFVGRVIAATHRPLDVLRREGRFRDDLYYRLATEALVLPPLRVRIAESDAELPALVDHVVERTLGEASEELAREVLGAIFRDLGEGYGWPGNVRELEQCVRQVLLSGRVTRAAAAHGEPAPSPTLAALLRTIETRTATGAEVLARYVALLHAELGSYDAVARVAGLDRRTVKKHVLSVTGP